MSAYLKEGGIQNAINAPSITAEEAPKLRPWIKVAEMLGGYGEDHGVPRVVAKGKDVVAERIRERATAHGVPLIENRSLAWILFDTADVDADIPMELYQAVAIVLAFVMQRRVGALAGAIRRVHVPPASLAKASTLLLDDTDAEAAGVPSGPGRVSTTPHDRRGPADGVLIG